MRLSHNIPSIYIYKGYNKELEGQRGSLNRISSGLKISSSKDDPHGIDKSEKINMQIRGLQMANRNLQDGISMLQSAEGGMNEISSSLQRIRVLTIQANNGINTNTDRTSIQNEIKSMIQNIDELGKGTEFNGVNLISNSSGKAIMSTVGANPNDVIDIPTYNFSSSNLIVNGKKLSEIDATSIDGADSALEVIDGVIKIISSARSKYGALENRFQSGQDATSGIADTLTVAYSSLIDADIAKEMVQFSKTSVITEASTAMLAQTNKFPMDILKILQNVR